MTNSEFVDDKKIKDILNFIKSMKHAEQIRMMFLCSLNGMRSINFAYLQIKDVFNDNSFATNGNTIFKTHKIFNYITPKKIHSCGMLNHTSGMQIIEQPTLLLL